MTKLKNTSRAVLHLFLNATNSSRVRALLGSTSTSVRHMVIFMLCGF